MHERHPVETSPRYHVVIWFLAGLVAAAVVYGIVQRANVPPVPPPAPPAAPAAPNNTAEPPAAVPKIPFTDITSEAGIKFSHYGGATGEKMLPESGGSGCAWIDYDSDGDADLLLISGRAWEWNGRSTALKNVLALYRNDKGKFSDVTAETGLQGDFYGQGAAVGDYDADGDDDLVITALGGLYLYRNNGGKFTHATGESGLKVDSSDWPTSTGFLDYDRDGDLDLFVVNYVRWSREADQRADRRVPGVVRSYAHPEGFDGTQNYLFRNDGGRFSDVSAAAGIHVNDKTSNKPLGKGLAVTFVDFDRDGWIDVFVANDTVPHFLFRNRGNGTFEEVAAERQAALNSEGLATSGMSADAAWLRNNNELAIGVGNFAEERSSLFISRMEGDRLLFADESLEAGIGGPTRDMLTWGLLFDDFDLDGRQDLVQTNGHLEETIQQVRPNQTYAQRGQLFWNTGISGPRIFAEVPSADTGDLAKPIVGRALASADIDGDGDLDLVITAAGGPPRLLRNDQAGRSHWLRVRLEGPAGNPHGIGATIAARANGITQRRTLMPTRSYLAQTEPIASFGLGTATELESLIVTWPDGAEQTVTIERVDRIVTVKKDVQTFAILGNIGKAQFENGEYQKAVATLERALRIKPDSFAMRRNLARTRYLWMQFPEAMEELRRLDAESPSAATSYLMGLTAMRLAIKGQLPKAEAAKYLQKAVEFDPHEATLRFQWANALNEAGQSEEADKQYRKTFELDPMHYQAKYRLALRIRQKDPDEYKQLMADYRRLMPANSVKKSDAAFEMCKYTKSEPPEAESPPQANAEVANARFAAADISTDASDNQAAQLPSLAAVAPLFLENNGRYQLVGVSPAGELVLIGFDDAGRTKVVARGEAPLGPVGNEAIVLVGNTRRDRVNGSMLLDAVESGKLKTPIVPAPAPHALVEGDRPEIAIVTPERTWFVRYQTTMGFVDLTVDSKLSAAAGSAARWIDMDQDGDIDLCVGSRDGFKVWRNNGDGTFVEATASFVLADAGPAVDLSAADFEGWNTGVDLVLAGPQATTFWRTEMNGQFIQDPVISARWPAAQRVIADDFNNDSLPDVVLVSPKLVTLAITKGQQQRLSNDIETIDAAVQLDDDNDGRLDLAVFGRAGGQRKALLYRNAGGQFADTSQPLPTYASPRRNALWALDFDADCDTDLLALDEAGRLLAFRNGSSAGNRQLKMSVFSNVENPSSIGTRVEVRRDDFVASRWTEYELPIEIGVGSRERLDTVQTLWVKGLAKNELSVEANCQPLRIVIVRFIIPESCPFLYACIDGEWQFVTDLLGAAPLNVAVARGVAMTPDPDEVAVLGPAERFAADGLAARLRISNELREVTYLDQVRLLAVDHAPNVTIFSRDRIAMTSVEGKQIIAGRDPVSPQSAMGSDGVDRTAALAKEDGQFASPGNVVPPPVMGFVEPLTIEFEFDDLGDTNNRFLALTGWFRFGSSSSNIAASQRSDHQVIWPKLEVRDAQGQWKVLDGMIGIPAGKTKTIVCDLAGKLPAGARRFRLTSSFEVRWDRIALYRTVPAEQIRLSEASPAMADLKWHGFHEFQPGSDEEPITPDLTRPTNLPFWFTALEGWSTRYGDVLPLVATADQMQLILNAGDGATLEFPADQLPPREPGASRTLLVYSRGWIKSGDPNGTSKPEVAPFPGSDAPPSGPAGDWQLEFNTRWVPRDRFAPSRQR
jgi:tetratricopeptide (TPR) repeat protein